jgi:hypothetical protein
MFRFETHLWLEQHQLRLLFKETTLSYDVSDQYTADLMCSQIESNRSMVIFLFIISSITFTRPSIASGHWTPSRIPTKLISTLI